MKTSLKIIATALRALLLAVPGVALAVFAWPLAAWWIVLLAAVGAESIWLLVFSFFFVFRQALAEARRK